MSQVIMDLFFKYNLNMGKITTNHKSQYPCSNDRHFPYQTIIHVESTFRKIIFDMESELIASEKLKIMEFTENDTPLLRCLTILWKLQQ